MLEFSINNLLINVFSNFVLAFFVVSCWQNCLPDNFSVTKLKKIYLMFFMAIIITFLMFIFLKPIKILLVFSFMIIVCYFLFISDFKKSVCLVIVSQVILWLVECSFIIFILLFKIKNVSDVTSVPEIFVLMNFYIVLGSLIILKTRIPMKFYNLMLYSIDTTRNNGVVMFCVFIISIIIISTTESYMELPIFVVLITNTIMAAVFIIIVIKSSKNKNEYNKINSKYQTSIYSLKEYEVMIDKFSMLIHENKNEFQTIRNMIKTGESKETVVKYIDRLIDNKIKDNDKIMKKASKIPEGGLKATIYSKLCTMEKLKIKYKLRISRDVRTTDLIDLDENLTLKICKILGVFLDNAIDAVENLKVKHISIEVYIFNEWLCIDITNNFKGMIDLTKISDLKYTTKGSGHGYGLPLVKQILDEEKNILENEKSINGNTFTQTLKIKM